MNDKVNMPDSCDECALLSECAHFNESCEPKKPISYSDTKCIRRLSAYLRGSAYISTELYAKEEGKKDDSGKLQWDLFPWAAARQVVKVMIEGAKKYERDNWKKLEDGQRRFVNAAIRHLTDYQEGKIINEEDFGLPHLAHAATSILFALWLDLEAGKK